RYPRLRPARGRYKVRLSGVSPLSSSFFTDPAATQLYTLSLHDALPIWRLHDRARAGPVGDAGVGRGRRAAVGWRRQRRPAHAFRSEEHTSELQSLTNIVCRLLLV